MRQYEIVVAGAGAAGIAAAKAAYEAGCRSILMIDSKAKMGGILLQCAHRGFGPKLTGPEYVRQMLVDFPKEIEVCLETTIVSVSERRVLTLSGVRRGVELVACEQLILATGCMEITPGMLPIGGTRPDGIYMAGQVQEMLNVYGQFPKSPIVILGSGDLGLIMAGQLAQAGLEIGALIEQRPTCGGLARNRKCLEQYRIPFMGASTITEIFGEKEVTAVKIVSSNTKEERVLECASLLIAVGLEPDRSLTEGIVSAQWIHFCGNCNRVHPMIEGVLSEGDQIGRQAYQAISPAGYSRTSVRV